MNCRAFIGTEIKRLTGFPVADCSVPGQSIFGALRSIPHQITSSTNMYLRQGIENVFGRLTIRLYSGRTDRVGL